MTTTSKKTTKKINKKETPAVDANIEVRATAKYVRGSAKKMRPIAKLIRGKQANEAIGILKNLPNKTAFTILKVLESAVANALNNNKLDKDKLVVSTLYINDGVFFKRHQPRARGRMFPIIKRTSHITLGVKELRGDS